MASKVTVIRRSDRFPVGTTVKAFPANMRHGPGVRPSGPASTEATVGADGTLTMTLDDQTAYVFWSEVGGESVNLLVGGSDFTAPGVLRERIAARRAEVGA